MNINDFITDLNNRANVARDNLRLPPEALKDLDKVVAHSISLLTGDIPRKGKAVLLCSNVKDLIEALTKFNILYGAITHQAILEQFKEVKMTDGDGKELIVKPRFKI